MNKKLQFIVNNEDGEMARFDTIEEARAFIKGARRFDRANGNPFEEHYTIDREIVEVDK